MLLLTHQDPMEMVEVLAYSTGKNLKMEQIKSDPFKSFEFKELLLHSSISITRIIVFYRPPIAVKNGHTHAAFLDDFSLLLEKLVSSTGRLLLAGDFNFHVNDPSDNTANKFLDLLSCFNLEVCNVYTPMHKNNNVLDLIVTRSGEETVLNLSVNDPVISDHFAVHCTLAIKRPPKAKLTISSRKLRTIDPDNLRRDIRSSALYNSPSQDITELCDQYDSVLLSILDKHAPLRTKIITSLCDLMLLGIARKSENRNQPAASLKGAGDAPNLNQTIDLMLINALLFRTPF